MKKLFTIFACLPLWAIAQPTINSFTPTVGSSADIHSISVPVSTPFGKTGNQTWNFASEPTAPLTFTVEIINPASAPDAASYPTANVVQKLSMGGVPQAYLYGRYTADSIWGLGVRYPTMPALNEDYTNPNVSYRFPLSLNGVIADISESTAGFIDTTERKYVAWGDITTPYGTFPNVVLFEESSAFNGVMSLNSYLWVSVATLDNIFELNTDDSLGEWFNVNLASSVGQEYLYEKYKMNVFPNPTVNYSNIQYTLPTAAEVSVEIIGLNGQQSSVLYKGTQQAGTHTLNTQEVKLAAGTYFARVVINKEPMVKRFTVTH
jgi:hypothetical protein